MAVNVTVRLKKEEERLELTIEDDGVGFDLNSASEKSSNGLMGIRERVFILNGVQDIQSKPGEGTRLEIKVLL